MILNQIKKPEAVETKYVPLIYAAIGVLLYLKAFSGEFIYDDRLYIIDNYLIKHLDFEGLGAIFTSFYEWDYLPVTFLSLAMDYRLFGLDPWGYHLTNLLLHILDAVLLHRVLMILTGSGRVAFWTALVFLIHPVHVESVAWISERKNVLSMAFFLLSFHSYLCRGPRLPSVLLFFLACLTKISVIVLPVLLILYDLCFTGKNIKTVLWDKIPYFLICAVLVLITLSTHSQGGTLRAHPEGNPLYTLTAMLVVIKEYLLKLLFPVNLNVWYPSRFYPSPLAGPPLLGLLVVGGLVLILRQAWQGNRMVFFGLAWFAISLLPVLHIIPIPQMMADRFLYIPSIGVILAGVVTVFRVLEWMSKHNSQFLVPVLGLALASTLSLTLHRIPVFKDDFTLWRDSVRTQPDNTIAMMYLGLTYWGRGDRATALEKLALARDIEPANYKAALYMGMIEEEKGNLLHAERQYEEVIELSPNKAPAYNHLAVLYGRQDKPQEALKVLDHALEQDPEFALAQFNRGVFLYQVGRPVESLEAFQRAIQLAPNNPMFHRKLGEFYLEKTDRKDLGKRHLKISRRLNPRQRG